MMKKLYLVRHGESEANVDEEVYRRVPDHRISLTEKGKGQAFNAGKELNSLLSETESSLIIHSPWNRAKMTATLIKEQLLDHSGIKMQEDPLIYEHSVVHSFKDMENKEDYFSAEKYDFGAFWYKSGTSESLADVYTRARIFVADLKANKYSQENLIIVTHGLFISMVKGVLNNWSVQEIMDMYLPSNCQILHEIIEDEH